MEMLRSNTNLETCLIQFIFQKIFCAKLLKDPGDEKVHAEDVEPRA